MIHAHPAVAPRAAWTPAYVADVVDQVLDRAAELGLHGAMEVMAHGEGLAPATVGDWVSRAMTVRPGAVPTGLLACRQCDRQMILVQLPRQEPVYVCRPCCGRRPAPAEALRAAVAAAVLQRAAHLVPRGHTRLAASYADRAIVRITVGDPASAVNITWRLSPRQTDGPTLTLEERVRRARSLAAGGSVEGGLGILRTALTGVDPAAIGGPPLDATTAEAVALLAELMLRAGDPVAAVPWAASAHRSMVRLHGQISRSARDALRILAVAHRHAGNLAVAAGLLAELVRHHSSAEGPHALPTLAAQATLALVLYQRGDCVPARRLLAGTLTAHRHHHPEHADAVRMRQEIERMGATCAARRHRHRVDSVP